MAELMRGERLQIMLTPDELQVLDDWRFEKRMPSRAAAVRELLKRGLAAEGWSTADRVSRSQEFGVTGETREASGDGVERKGQGSALSS
jgi:hypothetical protein